MSLFGSIPRDAASSLRWAETEAERDPFGVSNHRMDLRGRRKRKKGRRMRNKGRRKDEGKARAYGG